MYTENREKLKEMYYAAVKAVDPYDLVRKKGKFIGDHSFIKAYAKVYAISVGKAACEMARALEEMLGTTIAKGIAITKEGNAGHHFLKYFELFEAGHPIPDERGFAATQKVIDLLAGAEEEALVICLLSGGASALLVAPYGFMDLRAKRAMTEMLLKAGVDIDGLNTVRKHLSAVKGGRLAEFAYPARTMSFILSDVIGDDISVIASGPTAPDSSTYADALSVIQAARLVKKAPEEALKTLEYGTLGKFPETPGKEDRIFHNVSNVIVGNNAMAIDAAAGKAVSLGYATEKMMEPVIGEAKRAAKKLAKKALEIQKHIRKNGNKTACLISGGETTVTVKGSGRGGRNMEFALAFALEIEGAEGISLLSAGTDGTDGLTSAAGAFTDTSTVSSAKNKNMDPEKYLKNNDSYTFFDKLGDLFMPGPTGTNVIDVQIVIVE